MNNPGRGQGAEGSFPHLLVISASAGSGKTEALARRYLHLALSDGTPHGDISNILAVTFTRLAAREMKERILDLLKRLALGLDPGLTADFAESLRLGPEKTASRAEGLLASILSRYSDFQVATIDAFDNRLVGAAAIELELPPQSRVTTDYGDLASLALDSMLRDMSGGGAVDISVREYIDLLNEQPGETFAWRPAQKLEESFLRFLRIESKLAGGLIFRDAREDMERAFAGMEEALGSISKAARAAGIGLKNFDSLAAAVKGRDFQTLCRRKLSGDNSPCYSRDRGSPAGRAIAGEWAKLPALRAAAAEARAAGYYHPYGRCYRLFLGYLGRTKARSSTIHVDDMARMLASLLRRDIIPDIYLRLGDRLRHYMMDEFQDTDPQQWRALRPLLDEALAGGGSLFLVGDLKQAIYQFREADYRIMAGLVRDIRGKASGDAVPASVAGRAEVMELPCNRRSGGVIVDYTAEVFRKRLPALMERGIFGPDATGLTDYAQSSHPSLEGRGHVRVRHCPGDADSDEWARDQVLAAVIDAHGRGYGFGSMAVLAPRNDDLEKAVIWLTEAGIPAASSGSLDIRDRKAAAELASLMRFLDSPVDDLAFAEFLAGDVFRLSLGEGRAFAPGDLADLALQAKSQGRRLFRVFRESAAGGRLWDEKFEELYQKVGHYPLYDLLALACDTFGIWSTMPQEAAAVMKMLEAANGMAGDGGSGVRDFLEMWDGSAGEELSLELPEHTGSVRVLTVHAAKGLGFPVVVNLVHGGPAAGPEVKQRQGDDVGILYVPKYMADCSESLASALEGETTEAGIQFLNALYVACTRAREELQILVLPRREDDPLLELFPEEEVGGPGVAERMGVEAGEPWEPQSFGGPGYPEEIRAWSRKAAADGERGRRLHLALEAVEYLEGTPEEEAGAAVRMVQRKLGPAPDWQEMADDLARFLSRPEAAEAFARKPGRVVLREAEFADHDGRLFRMDRLVIDEGGVQLWDFKTGEPRDHLRQIANYRKLLEEIYPGKEVRARLAYIDRGLVEELP